MGKFSTYDRIKREERPWAIHPVWRGIGCVLIVLIPLMSYAAALLAQQANLLSFPPEMRGGVTIPRTLIVPYSNVGIPMPWHGTIRYTFLFYYFAFLFMGFGVLTFLYGIFYRFIGPPRYSKVDAAPIRPPRRTR